MTEIDARRLEYATACERMGMAHANGTRAEWESAASDEVATRASLMASVRALAGRADEAEREVARLRQAHWDGRAVGGFDNDGDPTPRAVVSDFAALIRSDWAEERKSHDELMSENDALESSLARLRERVAGLAEASRPFAAFVFGPKWAGHQIIARAGDCDVLCGYDGDGRMTGVDVNYSDFDRLRSALRSLESDASSACIECGVSIHDHRYSEGRVICPSSSTPETKDEHR